MSHDEELDQDDAGGEMSGEPSTKGKQTSMKSVQRDLSRMQRKLVKRRDEVAVLKAQIAILTAETKPLTTRLATADGDADHRETDRGIASYVLSARMHRRHNTTGVHRRNQLHEPILELYSKTAARAFAEQHGVQIPASLGSWTTPEDIEWEALPERFVIKSSRGGGGINVFPLERRGEEFYDFIASETVTSDIVTQKFRAKHQDGAVYFAEEFLRGRDGDGLPDDIKVFCFYGEPSYIEVRSEDWSRSENTVQRMRTFLADGTELVTARALIPRSDVIGTPQDFGTIADVSGRLSAAIRRPIERIDFYETDHGIVFGEITQNPGRPPALVPEWDRKLGDLYEDASARLFTDLVDEGHLALQYGDQAGSPHSESARS